MCEIISDSTYGHDPETWERAKTEAIRAIVAQAGPIFYSELTTHIGSIGFGPHDVSFHHLLGQISVEEDAAGRGMLSALVVHKDDGMPGQGFFDLAQRLGRNVADRERCWSEEVTLVLSHFPSHPLAA
jgi:hypothetical protein